MHWVLSREDVFLNSSSDGGLLEATLTAASQFTSVSDSPADTDMAQDVESMGIEPLFERGISDAI